MTDSSYQIPKDPKKIRQRIRSYERKLEKEIRWIYVLIDTRSMERKPLARALNDIPSLKVVTREV